MCGTNMNKEELAKELEKEFVDAKSEYDYGYNDAILTVIAVYLSD